MIIIIVFENRTKDVFLACYLYVHYVIFFVYGHMHMFYQYFGNWLIPRLSSCLRGSWGTGIWWRWVRRLLFGWRSRRNWDLWHIQQKVRIILRVDVVEQTFKSHLDNTNHIITQLRPTKGHNLISKVTGQFADKPTHGQSNCRLVNSRTSQLTEMSDLKFGVYNSSKCNFGQITPFLYAANIP